MIFERKQGLKEILGIKKLQNKFTRENIKMGADISD